MQRSRQQLTLLAQETVRSLLRHLASARPIESFVEAYAAANKRQGLMDSPFRYRELISTLTREALVAMTAQANAEMPHRLTGKKGRATGPEEQSFEIFREEYYLELARAMHWTPLELEEFWGDVELYAQMMPQASPAPAATHAAAARRGARPKPAKGSLGGPFADRCALLLDPSLLEKARHAAAALHEALEQATHKALASVFRPR